jgi:chaperonin GroEL (HSP60 family)
MTSMQVIEEAECSLHDVIIIVRRTIKNSTVVASGGTINVSNLMY